LTLKAKIEKAQKANWEDSHSERSYSIVFLGVAWTFCASDDSLDFKILTSL
jgi:hypothetical protein